MVGEGTLIEVLADDLLAAQTSTGDGASRSVVLLVDPDQQFGRLIPYLQPELELRHVGLLSVDGLNHQFATKMDLIRRDVGSESTIVYIAGIHPDALAGGTGGSEPALWALVDYRYRGVIWDGTDRPAGSTVPQAVALDRWLERHGVTIPATARTNLTEGGRDSRLARFAAKRARRRLDHWPRPLTASSVREELAGDPRDSVIRLLIDPKGALAEWADDREDVLDRIGTTYGIRVEDADPESLADDIAVTLALTDAWDVFGRLDDFPFLTRLPRSASARDRALVLLRSDLLHRMDVLGRLRTRIGRLEPELLALETWAVDKPGVPAALPHLLESRVQLLLARLGSAWISGPAACLEVLEKELPATQVPEDTHASLAVLQRVRRLGKEAKAARDAVLSIASPAMLVERYASTWHTVDGSHLAILASCRDVADMNTTSALANRLYFDYVDAVSQRFSDLVELVPTWPPPGTQGVLDAASEVWAPSKSRQAVLIVDAMRFDLARQVADALGAGATMETVLSTLPSTTPFGMTALLPGATDDLNISYEGDKLSISSGSSQGLQERAGRKAYIESFLAARNPLETVAFAELESISQGDPIPKTQWLVLFSYSLDDRGHSLADAASLPGEAERLVPRIVRAVERLHQAGVARVEIVTDHGFLYQPPELTDSLGHPDLPAAQAISKNARYAVLRSEAAATEVVHHSSPLAFQISLGFPRGIRTLSKASIYLHGGISLQECVIARVSSRAALTSPRIDVEIEVTVTKVSSGTIPVRVRPATGQASGQMTLTTPRPLNIQLTVEAGSGEKSVEVAVPVDLEVRADSPELTSALYLRDDVRLENGTLLTIRARDVVSGESLFVKQLPLVVDWEG